MRVVVLDNASDDGSADAIAAAFPQVELIRSPDNLGFARANNVIAETATSEWLLLLNSDTEVLRRRDRPAARPSPAPTRSTASTAAARSSPTAA